MEAAEILKEDPLVNLLESFIKVYLSSKDHEMPQFETVKQTPSVPRMRTAKEAVEEIRASDPKSGITEYYVKQLAINKKIPSVMAGSKRLINLDELFKYLQKHMDEPTSEEKKLSTGEIRPISE